jgi:hypothetical protein
MCCALHKSKLDRMLAVLTSWNSWKRSLMRGARKLWLCMRVVRRTVDGGGGQSVY